MGTERQSAGASSAGRARSRLPYLAALAALALPAGNAAAREEACGLTVTAEPPVLVRGRDRQAEVRVVTGGAVPRLTASVGRIENLRAEGRGAFVGRYLPPSEHAGPLAVLAAVAGGDCGFTILRIGEGVGPRARPVALALDPVSVRADRDESVAVYAFLAAQDGSPSAAPPPSLAAARGEVSAPAALGKGVWRASWRIPPGRAGPTELVAGLETGSPGTATLERVPGPVSSMAVELDRQGVVAGQAEPVGVVVRTLDSAGNRSDGLPTLAGGAQDFWIECDTASVAPAVHSGPGTWSASLLVPPVLRDRREAVVAAHAGSIVASARLALHPGPPAVLRAHFIQGSPALGGSATGAISVTALDAYGNLADASTLRALAAHGEVGSPERDGAGTWRLPYRSVPFARDGEEDLVQVRLGDLSIAAPVHLSVVPPLLGVSSSVGLAGRSSGSGLYASAEVSGWTRIRGQEVGVALGGLAWTFGRVQQVDAVPGPVPYRSQERYLALAVSGAWRRALGRRWRVAAAAGGGGAYVRSQSTLSSQPAYSATRWVPATTAAVFLGLDLWGGGPFAEARAAWLGDPRLENLRGSLTPLSIAMGYRLDAF